jgi:hypothetical protein
MDMMKLLAKLPSGYAEEVAGYDDARLQAELVQCEANIHQVETEKAADEKLNGARELVKDLAGPYRDAVSAQRAKIKYVLAMLLERGKLPEGEGLGG